MPAARKALDLIKRAVLPRGRRFRRVLMGPAAGSWMMLDLTYQLRLLTGIYERELWSSYRKLLRPGMRSFDIGGRDGYSALVIARRTGAEVISFECDAAGVAEMKATFERNGPALRAVQAWVGSETSPAATMTLDRAADEYFRPDFIKIDVEGAEVDVLRGAFTVLERDRPSMIIEVHGTDAEAGCRDILGRFRYHVTTIDRARLFPEERPLAHNRWLTCVA